MSHYTLMQKLSGLPNDSLDDDRYLVAFWHLISIFPSMIRVIQPPVHFWDHSACPANPSDPNSPLTQAQLDDLMDMHDQCLLESPLFAKTVWWGVCWGCKVEEWVTEGEVTKMVWLGKDLVKTLGCSSCSRGFSTACQLKQHARVHWCSKTLWPCTYDILNPSQAPIHSSFTVLSTTLAPAKLFYCNISYILFWYKNSIYFLCSLCLRYSVWNAGYMCARVGAVLVLVRVGCD